MKALRQLLVLSWAVAWMLVPSALVGAHANLVVSFPADGATVSAPPTEVILQFSEAVDVRFSTFKVYHLPAEEEDPLRLRAAAATLVSEVLRLRDDAERRADVGAVTGAARYATQINIALKENLAPGNYVVMWSVLSVDTHTTQGFYVFRYQPD